MINMFLSDMSADFCLCALASGPVYIGEVTAPEIRGKVMSFWQMFFSVGSFIAYWINFACARNRTSLGHWDWKMVSKKLGSAEIFTYFNPMQALTLTSLIQ